MYPEVGAVTAAMGLASTPLVLAAVRWAPSVRRAPALPATSSGSTLSADPVGSTLSADLAPMPSSGPSYVALAAVLSAGVLGLLGLSIGADPALPAYLLFGVVTVVLGLVDLAHHRLPDVLTLPSYVAGVVLLGTAAVVGSGSGSLPRALGGAVIGFTVYAALFLVARSGIGAGDVKYAGVIGLHAAWVGWGALVVALVGGFVVGTVVSLGLLVTGRAGLKTALPFGPSMAAGAVVAVVWGQQLAGAWLG